MIAPGARVSFDYGLGRAEGWVLGRGRLRGSWAVVFRAPEGVVIREYDESAIVRVDGVARDPDTGASVAAATCGAQTVELRFAGEFGNGRVCRLPKGHAPANEHEAFRADGTAYHWSEWPFVVGAIRGVGGGGGGAAPPSANRFRCIACGVYEDELRRGWSACVGGSRTHTVAVVGADGSPLPARPCAEVDASSGRSYPGTTRLAVEERIDAARAKTLAGINEQRALAGNPALTLAELEAFLSGEREHSAEEKLAIAARIDPQGVAAAWEQANNYLEAYQAAQREIDALKAELAADTPDREVQLVIAARGVSSALALLSEKRDEKAWPAAWWYLDESLRPYAGWEKEKADDLDARRRPGPDSGREALSEHDRAVGGFAPDRGPLDQGDREDDPGRANDARGEDDLARVAATVAGLADKPSTKVLLESDPRDAIREALAPLPKKDRFAVLGFAIARKLGLNTHELAEKVAALGEEKPPSCGAKHYCDNPHGMPTTVRECALPAGHGDAEQDVRHEADGGVWWWTRRPAGVVDVDGRALAVGDEVEIVDAGAAQRVGLRAKVYEFRSGHVDLRWNEHPTSGGANHWLVKGMFVHYVPEPKPAGPRCILCGSTTAGHYVPNDRLGYVDGKLRWRCDDEAKCAARASRA